MASLPHSTFLDFTSYGMTTATTVADAYDLSGPVSDAPTVNVALVLARANLPDALLGSGWASRQQQLQALNDSGTLWSTYGASSSDYNAVLSTLDDMGITVIGDAAGSDGYVTSAESRTVWVSLDAPQFEALFGAKWHQRYSNYLGKNLYYWDGGLSVPDTLPIAGLWFDTFPEFGTLPGASDLAGDVSVIPPQGPLSIGNALNATGGEPINFSGTLADLFYNFPLAGLDVPTVTVGLVEPGVGDVLPDGADYTFQEGLDAFRQLAGISTPGSYYVIDNGGEDYCLSNPGERSFDVAVVTSAVPGSTIGLYAGSGFAGNAQANGFTAFQAAFWDQTNNPAVVSSSFSIYQQSRPGSPFSYAVQQLFIDAALRNITMIEPINDFGSSYGIPNGLANPAIATASPYIIVVSGTSITTVESAPLDETLASLYALAMAGDPATLWLLIQGGLTRLPSALSESEAEQATLLEAVWNAFVLRDRALHPGNPFVTAAAGGGGVDITQGTPWYQAAFGLAPTTANPGGGTGRGLPDVAALAGGNMRYNSMTDQMTPGELLLGGAIGTSGAAPLWASLIAQIDTIFNDQGLPNLGFANDLLYIAAAIAPASFNDISLGNNVTSFFLGGPLHGEGGEFTFTGYGYYAGPGYDLVSGLGTPNGVLLARSLTAIAHAQMWFDDNPAMLDGDDTAGWTSGADQSLMFQAMSAAGALVAIGLGSGGFGFGSAASDAFAWTSRLAQQSLQADFDPALVRLFDKQAQGWVSQSMVASGDSLAVAVNGMSAAAIQGTLSSAFGFADFVSGEGVVRVARAVAVAETAGGADDQVAIVRLRQNGEDSLSLTFYRVDDLAGTIAGLRPGEAGYAQVAEERAYQIGSGGTAMGGPGYGNYQQATLLGVDAGDLIAMKLFNNDSGATFWAFAQANEEVDGQEVGHLWSYGLNTWGWEDTWGGGDRDFNDFIVQLDFTSAAGHGWLV